jgi:hypothetical protein
MNPIVGIYEQSTSLFMLCHEVVSATPWVTSEQNT